MIRGDRVKIKEGTQFYYQAPGIMGTVTGERGVADGWEQVQWDDGYRTIDSYPVADLILMGHQLPKDEFSEDEIDTAMQIIGAE